MGLPVNCVLATGLVLAVAGCNEAREREEPPVVFADIDPILQEHCVRCHSGPDAAANYSVEDYLETIRCVPADEPPPPPATLPSDSTAPILVVLERPDPDLHAELLNAAQTEALTTWVVEGAFPANRSTHPGQWTDPRTGDVALRLDSAILVVLERPDPIFTPSC